MKNVFVWVVCAFVCASASAQTRDSKESLFQLSLIPPVSTNGVNAAQYTNRVSFNLLAGISRNEEAFTFTGLSTIILNDARGVQFAGLSNYTGNRGKGVQFAGLTNINKNQFGGLQFSGLLNTAASMRGFQFSGLANVAGEVSGFQFGGLFNTASTMRGFQFSGLANVAGDVSGFQFGGLINIARNVKGVQFAGLINIAEHSDCPIGLVNIIRDGEKGVAVTYDGIGNTVVSFRSGGKYTYGILGVGYNHKISGNSLVVEGGLGAHFPLLSWFRINNEIKFTNIGSGSDKPVLNVGYSLIPAFRIGRHFELFAGVGINYAESKDLDARDLFPGHSLWKRNRTEKFQWVYVGYQGGIQYLF